MIEYVATWANDPLGYVHVALALIALAAGAAVLALPKGRGPHKLLGYIYFASMLAVNVTALSKYDFTGSVNLFHVAAAFSLATLALAGAASLRYRATKGRGALAAHAAFMTWSYYGLVVALIAEVFTRALPFMLHGEGGWMRFTLALSAFMLMTGWAAARLIRHELTKFLRH